MEGGLSINSLSVEMDTGGLRDRESETVLGDPLLNVNTQLNGALKMLQQVSGLKHMDQSVIHHLLEGLTQAARERNMSIVGKIRRILPGFWNWNQRSLPPRWGDVPGSPNVIEKFRKQKRVCWQASGRCLRN
ncbi:hypothetical protein PoB_000755600 [Plakobranchus ocellatus]|uniref:Uncharacterized protein n=1 Tax=Plakobranchus ocellatus TaxID=259542 RepID=A0AAV3Y1E1_9GAST|nr:hypothetical protein PoB_000755600 [Plakobranchus ocellatus]